jgi:hypothetical protein
VRQWQDLVAKLSASRAEILQHWTAVATTDLSDLLKLPVIKRMVDSTLQANFSQKVTFMHRNKLSEKE